MIKIIGILIIVVFINKLSGQTTAIDTIDFNNKLRFEKTINWKDESQLNYIQYSEINGPFKKIEYYDFKQRIVRDQIYGTELLREIKYKYFENNQITKRYDITNNEQLSTLLNVNINYPALARENEIEGVVEVDLHYDENCIPKTYKILNKIDYGINEEVDNKMKIMIKLAVKYQVSFDECKLSDENFKINFKLK